MHNWTVALDRWWSDASPRQLFWKMFLSAGLAGSVLAFLALQLSGPQPGTHFASLFCGFLGLLSGTVSVSGGAMLLVNSIGTPSQMSAMWSKFLASFLPWSRKTLQPSFPEPVLFGKSQPSDSSPRPS
jgi:hypothetical protein